MTPSDLLASLRRWLMAGLWLGGGALLAAPFVACGPPENECDYGDAYCDGRVAVMCGDSSSMYSSHRAWGRRDCAAEGKFCAASEEAAFCALSAEPEPTCEEGAHCVSDTHARECRSGHVVGERTCAYCDPRPIGFDCYNEDGFAY